MIAQDTILKNLTNLQRVKKKKRQEEETGVINKKQKAGFKWNIFIVTWNVQNLNKRQGLTECIKNTKLPSALCRKSPQVG